MVGHVSKKLTNPSFKSAPRASDFCANEPWYPDFRRFIELKGLRPRSRKSYLGWVTQLATHYPGPSHPPLPELPAAAVLDFLVHLQNERRLRPATLNQAVCALRTFYRDHLGLSWDIWGKISIKRDEPLPHVLTRADVALLLRTFRDGRYRAYFTLVYQCGLRMSEALSIKPADIDGQRLVLRIPEGKGGHPREVPITPVLLQRLRDFWSHHGNRLWLFPGPGRGWNSSGLTLAQALRQSTHPMTKASVWTALKVAKAECGLAARHAKLCIHTLRHSFATHMLEAGTSVRQVAACLGHRSLKPVMVYLHLTEVSETKAREALATLAAPW